MAMRVFGSSHRLAAPSRLQAVVAHREEIFARLLQLRAEEKVRGAILLATCNRLDIVVDVAGDAVELEDIILGFDSDLPYHDLGDEAATHYLLRVATGLESMVRGECQILGQLRDAFRQAEAHDMLSPALRVLRDQLISSARKIRQRAGLGNSKVSIASLAARQLERAGRRLVVVGAGETGRLAISSLVNRDHTDLLIVNRTLKKAVALANHFGVRAMALDDFLIATESPDCPAWDGVLFAVDSREPLFFARNACSFELIVDISMPCVIDGSLRGESVEILDLDAIALLVDAEGERHQSTLGIARELVNARARKIHQTLLEVGSRASIHLGKIIDRHLETAELELQSMLDTKLRHLSEVDQEYVRQVTLRTAKRNAHLHLKDVRERSRS